jgi:fibronectin-binding autotransporter adhesin
MKSFIKHVITICFTLAALCVARADTLTWDPANTGGSGGNGTWNLNSSLNWWNGAADVKWLDNSATGTNTAVFGGTAGNVTLPNSLSASNLQFLTAGYTLSGSGTLTLGAGGIDASTVGAGTITIGPALSLSGGQQPWLIASGSTLAVTGAVNRATGAAVDFSASGITSTTLANANGILGGWATVGGANSAAGDWAANDGSGNIITYAGYTVVSSTGSSTQTGAGASTQNWISGDPSGVNNYITTLSANAALNSLVMEGDFNVNSGVTLTLNSGGLILRGVSRWMLGGSPTTSFLTSGSSTGELFVHVPDVNSGNNWTIWPIIEDNGATPVKLIVDGASMVKLGNMSTYTGGTWINSGILASTAGAEYGQGNQPTGLITPFGSGTITINSAQLQLGSNPGNAFGSYSIPNSIVLNNSLLAAWDASQRIQGNVTIGPGGAAMGSTFNAPWEAFAETNFPKALFIDGLLTGTGDLTIQDPYGQTGNAWDTSCAVFTSQGTAAQNTYSGQVTVNPLTVTGSGGSYLYLVGTNVMANATITLTGDNLPATARMGISTLLFGNGSVDGPGYYTIGGLAGGGSVLLNDTMLFTGGSGYSNGLPVALTVGYNNSTTTYSGVMSGAGSLTKVGSGTLTLSGVNTYTGNTTVNGGILAFTSGFVNSPILTVGAGATLDVSALGGITLIGSETLYSGGTINGLTLASGAVVYLDLGTLHNSTNDLITVGGTLTANNNVIHLKAPSTSVSLDTTADYVLMNAPSGISGSFAAGPEWDIAPANAAHYTIVTGPTTVTLHYSATTSGPVAGGSASPLTVLRNQSVTITVNATNGSPGTVNSVVVDASPIGGSSTLALTKVGTGGSATSVWTNTITVTPDTLAGSKTLAGTVSDTSTLTTTINIPLTVVVGNDVWGGAGGNANFSTGLNWTNHLAPGYVGDSLEFAGTTQLSPNMDHSYTITSLLFDSGAGAFTIGTGNSSALTLSGGVVNNSANAQTLNVPITFTGAETINAAAGNIALGGVLSGASSVSKIGNNALTLSAAGNSFSGNLGVTGGTLNITAGSTTVGSSLSYAGYRANSGTLNISGGSFTAGGELWVGGSDQNGTAYNALGNVMVSGGAAVSLGKLTIARGNNSQNTVSGIVTLNSGALSSENDILMGFAGAGTAKLVVNGGTLSIATATKRWVILSQWDATSSELDINGGQMNINANTDIRFAISGNAGSNVFNLNSGAVTFYSDNATTVGGSGVVDLHQGNGSTVVNAFNLNGGTLTVSGVTSANSAGTRLFNMNGGTLKATGANVAFVSLGTGNAVANVRNGGAIIDDGGFGIEIDQPLVHSTIAGDNATDGGLIKLDTGTLTLGGANTYSGATLINAGILALTGNGEISNSVSIAVGAGATFDVSALAGFTLGGSQALLGSGTNNGSILTSAGSKIYAGTDGTYGTNTFNSNLTLATGAACYFDLGTIYNGNNDLMVVTGIVTANGNVVHIKGPSSPGNLDSTADYVLISSANPISGSFATTPVWDVAPANAGHFTVVTTGSTVTLHYNAIAAPVVSASAKPTTLLRNQPTVITANVLPGSSAISTVTVDLTPLGGSGLSLVQSNTSNLYTNSATISPSQSPGNVTLTVTATDTSSRSGSAGVTLATTASTEVWDGAGGNPNWSTNPNWTSGYAPGYAGDAVLFAGSLGLAPNMDNNYSATGLAFSNNASSFSIGTGNGSLLTLTANGIVNNSASAQTINVPVTMTAAESINAAAGNLNLGSPLTNNSSLLTVAGASNTVISGVISGAGLTKTGNGALTINATGNSFSGNLGVLGGVLNVSGGSTTFGTSLSYAGYDTSSGNLNISGGTFTSGGELWVGGSDQNGPANTASGTLTVSGGATVSLSKLSVARGNWFDNTVSGIVTLNSGSISSENDLLMGFAGAVTGKVVINGGTLNVATATKRWIILSQWDTANSEIDVNGGQLNVNANTDIRYAISGNNGTNVFNLNSGGVTFYSDNATTIGGSGVVDLHQGSGSTVVNTFNLNGGTLTVSAVYAANASGTRAFNFNGGTLKATANNGAFLAVGTGNGAINVRNGGAVVDDSGFTVAIGQALQHSSIAGDNATDGGLTKLGTGTLTLGSANTYNGPTTVKAGTLEVVLATLATTSTVSISNSAVLKLDFATTNQVGALVLNGVAQSPGVYSTATSPSYISGTGSLLVASPIPTTPTNITYTVSGGTLHLSWPANYVGWLLQAQTNAPSKGLSTNWVDVPGSGSVTSTNIPISPAIGSAFFRLRHP